MYTEALELVSPPLSGLTTRARSPLEVIELIREGIGYDAVDKATQELHITKQELASLIGYSQRSLQRKKAGDRLSPAHTEHLLAIVEVMAEATRYFGDREKALIWLKTPSLAFGGKPPYSLLDTMSGVEFVSDRLNRLKYGMTA